MSKTLYLTEKTTFTFPPDDKEIDVTLTINAQLVDNGIGGYEFWGCRGTHHDWTWECNLESVVAAEEVDKDVLNELAEAWVEDNQFELSSKAADLMADQERDYPEREYEEV